MRTTGRSSTPTATRRATACWCCSATRPCAYGTQGGPGRSSETLAVTMYREGFILFNQGYSAAIAVIIGLAAMIFSYFYLRSVLDQEKNI